MKNEKTIEVLNTLVQINNDRIEGYETAFKETEEPDLKAHFSQFMLTSQKCKQELVNEVTRLGGEPTDSTRVSGKFFRVWMDVKAAITAKTAKQFSAPASTVKTPPMKPTTMYLKMSWSI